MNRRVRHRCYDFRHDWSRVCLAVDQLESRCVPAAVAQLTPGTYDPGHILVGDKSGQVHQVALAPGVSVAEAIASYQNAAGVAYAEPDYLVQADVTPNDTYYSLEWGLNNTGQTVNGATGTSDADIDAPEAWNITTGSTTTVVADIDTGIDYTHPDLYLNIWINQDEIPTTIRNNLTDTDGDGIITFYDLNNSINIGAGKITDLNGNGRIDGGDLLNSNSGWENGVDNDADGKADDLIGWDFVNNDNDPLDDNGHGSHTAGTIGAIGNNGAGVTGVNWRVQIAAFKFLNSSGSGSISNAQGSLDLAVANGIKISNNSWGGGGFSQSFLNSLNAANTAGHIFVAAAGNSSSNNDSTPSYPASYNAPNVISVAATDSNDHLASFSNYGTTSVDIAAPGVNVASTYSNGQYVYLSGTSMATPHVTGVVALLRSEEPGIGVSDAINRVLSGADVVSGLTTKVAAGRRLNAFNALNTGGGGGDTAGPQITSAVPNGTSSVSSVRLTFNEAIDGGSFTAADITNASAGLTNIAVSQVSSTEFDVTFNTVTASGAYSFTVGPNIDDLTGNPMDQNNNGTNGEAGDSFTESFTVNDTAGPRVTSAVPDGTTSVGSVRLTFSEAINAASFTAADITNASSGLTNIAVTQVSSTQFDVTFDTVTAPGSYSFDVGPDIRDLAGNQMDQNADGVTGDGYHTSFTVSPPTQTFTNSTRARIRDRATTTSTITINQDITIADLNATIDLTHSFDSDLIITLRSPSGVTVTLANRRGGSGDNYTNTVFDDEASAPIANGVAPFTGTFRPEGFLSSFDNANARGTWTLSIQDVASRNTGRLNSWSITIGSGGAGGASVGGPGHGFFNVPFLGAGALTSSSANLPTGSLPAAPAPATHTGRTYLALLGDFQDGRQIGQGSLVASAAATFSHIASNDDASFHGGAFVGSSAANPLRAWNLAPFAN